MCYYTGLDVSLEETFITIIDKEGKIVHESKVKTGVKTISGHLKSLDFSYEKIGIESGQLSIPLCKGLISRGLPAICIDARKASSLLSSKINKNDKNDAKGIADLMRGNYYEAVAIKSEESCKIKILLGSRNQIMKSKQQVMGTIRGLLKIYGCRIPAKTTHFISRVRATISGLNESARLSIEAILPVLETIDSSLQDLDKMMKEYTDKDLDCQLLMTVPGVGVVTALTYKSTIDDESRFEDSYNVGAYIGLTPRQYASGEIDRHGSISKMGPKYCRTMLYEAAQSLLVVSKKKHNLKSFGLRLAKKKGMKKAIVAVARKLAVIMHRILITKQEFYY